MRILELSDFSGVDDPIQTEALFAAQIQAQGPTFCPEWTYVKVPLAWLLNHRGITKTQAVLDQIFSRVGSDGLVFVCQHIRFSALNFRDAEVFTPHASVDVRAHPIPHHPVQISDVDILNSLRTVAKRKYLASFLGVFWTHPTRSELERALVGHEYYVRDTGTWHFQLPSAEQAKGAADYLALLLDSKFSLCPRGTGPSSVRLWESLALGAVPVIISDAGRLPLEDELDWSAFCVLIPESEVALVAEKLKAYTDERIQRMASMAHEVYLKHFQPSQWARLMERQLKKRTIKRQCARHAP